MVVHHLNVVLDRYSSPGEVCKLVCSLILYFHYLLLGRRDFIHCDSSLNINRVISLVTAELKMCISLS